nr:2-oxoglutarate dehydrogenase, mitochondrial-like [Tanacetum cinerariifolium]
MTWFRAGSSVAKLAIRKTISQTGSYTSRTCILHSGAQKFHTTVSKSKAQSAPVPRGVPLSRLIDSFLDGTSSIYLEELQRAWEAKPNSVDESGDNLFRNFVGQMMTDGCVLTVLLLCRTSGELLQEYKGHTCKSFKMDCRLTNNDAHVIGGSEDGYLFIWDLVDASVVSNMVVKGVVCNKNMAHRRMTSRIEKPRILILGGALEY